jgi:hypothetical protein
LGFAGFLVVGESLLGFDWVGFFRGFLRALFLGLFKKRPLKFDRKIIKKCFFQLASTNILNKGTKNNI